jgi:hypothetical protein
MTEHNVFCWAEDEEDGFQQPRYRAFNKEVGRYRYSEILMKVSNILKDLILHLDNEAKWDKWKNEWKKVTYDQWKQILAIPEADQDIIEKIIGFELY